MIIKVAKYETSSTQHFCDNENSNAYEQLRGCELHMVQIQTRAYCDEFRTRRAVFF